MKRWTTVLILAAGQFVMVLDSSVMNVSISQLVADLHTSVANIQLAITLYTLVMASLMLTGGKLGDVLGRRRAFVVGLGIYGLGSLLTALAPNLTVLIIGWSVIEGLGAILVIPAIMALTATSYEGNDRGLAYGVLGGIAAAGVAVGPLIGGWVTSNLSWRYVFVAESALVVVLMISARSIPDAPRSTRRDPLDGVGILLSAAGLGAAVFAILRSSAWGWIQPRRPPQLGERSVTPFGFAPTVPLIVIGAGFLVAFVAWERHRQEHHKSVLLRLDLLASPVTRAGLATLLMQQLLLAGTFFVMPLYLQVVLGLDAFHSGMKLLPLSLTMFVSALGAARLGASVSPRRLVRIGLMMVGGAQLMLLAVIDDELRSRPFALSLAVLGVGVGLLASQLGNVILSSVDERYSSEAGGLQGTAQNLGASLGTAFVGAILLGGLASGFQHEVSQSTTLPAEIREAAMDRSEGGLEFVASSVVRDLTKQAKLEPASADAIVSSYAASQLAALKSALGVVALVVAVAFMCTRQIPDKPLTAKSDGDSVSQAAASP